MGSNPYYEAPEKDQGRESRTQDWNRSEILSFLDEQYDNPLDEFGVENYDELESRVEELGLSYEEDSDWRYEQVSDLGEKDYNSETVFGIVPYDKVDEVENPEPWEVKLCDENGEVKVHWKNR